MTRSDAFAAALAVLLAFVLVPAGRGANVIQHDGWLQDSGQYPAFLERSPVDTNAFAGLWAEVLTERLRVTWRPAPGEPPTPVLLHSSADQPGHWPARDWESHPMIRRESGVYERVVPVEDPDVPVVYFVTAGVALTNGATLSKSRGSAEFGSKSMVSPMRVFVPRALGLEEPTKIFWSFIDGFEQELKGWRMVGEARLPLSIVPEARAGAGALSVPIPERKRSVTVGTTRIRGWQIKAQAATGIRLYVRTRSGEGRVRFSLLAHAYSDRQVVALWPEEPRVTSDWQRVDLPFDQLAGLPLHEADFFALEFIAPGPAALLLDDVQLLGPWRMEFK